MQIDASAIRAHIEAVLLELFWYYAERGVDRIELLKVFAAQPVTRGEDWSATSIRTESNDVSNLRAENCFSCRGVERKLYWHHIVQVQHGGSNLPRNRIAICYRCHARIHPWLPSDRKGESLTGEWWSIADVVEDAKRRETPVGDVSERTQSTTSQPETQR